MPRKPKLTPTTNDTLQGTASRSDGGSPVVNPFGNYVGVTPLVSYLPHEQKANGAASPAEKKPLKIACIGTAPSSRMLAPYNDPAWTIWGCSPGNIGGVIPRIDAWFEIHGTNLLEPENKHYAPQYIDWMSKLTVPVYMQDKQLVPHAIPVPKDELVREFGPYFFTSTFAWMIACAIKAIMAHGVIEGSQINLYGIDMASRDEYIIQRPGAYKFFEEAARRGIKMDAPYESDIMQPPPLYGYSDVTPYGRKLRARRDELKERIASMEQQVSKGATDITYLKGALEDNDYQLSIQGGVQDNSDKTYLERLINEARSKSAVVSPPVEATPVAETPVPPTTSPSVSVSLPSQG